MRCVATTAFGLEAVLKRELTGYGFSITDSAHGRIYFEANVRGMVRANLRLRTAERVYVVLGAKRVETFDELFDWIESLPLGKYLHEQGQYIVNAKSHKSTLFSVRDIQSIGKKALIRSLQKSYGTEIFPETKEKYALLINIQKDNAELWLDTSGIALHKRGYRKQTGKAPLKETLAAALVLLSHYHETRTLYDPFCGSGTIPIEAAMVAKNIAPGLHRRFAFQRFFWVSKEAYTIERREALKAIKHEPIKPIVASDSDPGAIASAKENAEKAGVDEEIHFEIADFSHQIFSEPAPVFITNPPYGERMGKEEVSALYKSVGEILKKKPEASFYILTPVSGVEQLLGKKADRTRVLFNGPIKTRLYQYIGPPPKKNEKSRT